VVSLDPEYTCWGFLIDKLPPETWMGHIIYIYIYIYTVFMYFIMCHIICTHYGYFGLGYKKKELFWPAVAGDV